MEIANVLKIKPKPESVKEYDTWKAIFIVKLFTTNQASITQEKKYEIEFLNKLLYTALMSIKEGF